LPALLAAALYVPSLADGNVFDDTSIVRDNPVVAELREEIERRVRDIGGRQGQGATALAERTGGTAWPSAKPCHQG
jgi:hypothetical protein